MAEWLYEEGIGESRAILVEEDEIVEAQIELPSLLRAGSIVEARLTRILVPGRRGIAAVAEGAELLVEPLPGRLTEGQRLRLEVVREAVAEEGRDKLAKGRVTEEGPRPGPTLHDRLMASPHPVRRHTGPGPDLFEESGWTELLEQAVSGDIGFSGGALRMSLTPAMTLFDVDGALPPAELAIAGAQAAGRAIRRFGIAGSIGIDLPTLGGKAERQAAAEALDRVLPQPFERTAVNGFGFLQIVRRKERASLPEILRNDPVGVAARALMRRAERASGAGERTLHAAPAIISRIEAQADWQDQLSRRLGTPLRLRADPSLSISGGHVQSAHA